MVPRTRFGDDFVIQEYSKPRGVRQLVLLGAGMDARAYRLRLPELRVFEVGLRLDTFVCCKTHADKHHMVVDLKVLVGNVVDDGFHVIDGWFGESFFGSWRN